MKHGNEVYLAVVDTTPMTVDEAWERYQRMQKFVKEKGIVDPDKEAIAEFEDWFGLNFTSDSYNVVYDPNAEDFGHIAPIDVFTPHFPIPEHIRENLLTSHSSHRYS